MKKLYRMVSFVLLISMVLLSFTGCGSKNSDSKGKVVVGAKLFTEGNILSEIYALALEKNGYEVDRNFDIAGALVHEAITAGDIDLYPEYTGTALLQILNLPLLTDPDEVYEVVKKEYKEQFNIEWLDYAPMNDGSGLAIRTETANKYGIKTISDLQKHADKLRFASQGEFDEREDGLVGLCKLYGSFNFKSLNVYDSSLRYDILANDEADVTPAYTTEANLSRPEFTLLEDDKNMWPPYNAAPIVRDSVLKEFPEIAPILNAVSAEIDTETITNLNAQVDLEHKEYEEVAAEFFATIEDKILIQ